MPPFFLSADFSIGLGSRGPHLIRFDPDPYQKKSPEGRRLLAAGIAVLFACVAFAQAYFKLLWGDEFVTLWIGQQRSFAGIWRALDVASGLCGRKADTFQLRATSFELPGAALRAV